MIRQAERETQVRSVAEAKTEKDFKQNKRQCRGQR